MTDKQRVYAIAAASLAGVLLLAPRASVGCLADCNGDGEVKVSELVLCVRIADGSNSLSECDAADSDRDGELAVDEVVEGVSRALYGCESVRPIGSECEAHVDCGSGFCIDGVCCHEACEEGICRLPGRVGECSPFQPNGAVCTIGLECSSGVCDPAGLCCERACPTGCQEDGRCVIEGAQ